jgi:hypothetical protein
MKKVIIIIILFNTGFNVYSQDPLPLVLDLNIGDEIWIDGEVIFFNGWPPNHRMLVSDNKIIGIDEKNLPPIITDNLFKRSITGKFRLKLIGLYGIPYYENPLMTFTILGYEKIILSDYE